MAIDNGDFVRVNFTGKVKETDEVLDGVCEQISEKNDEFHNRNRYGLPYPDTYGCVGNGLPSGSNRRTGRKRH